MAPKAELGSVEVGVIVEVIVEVKVKVILLKYPSRRLTPQGTTLLARGEASESRFLWFGRLTNQGTRRTGSALPASGEVRVTLRCSGHDNRRQR